MPSAGDITGLVLAGGRGLRMGGLDKGMQSFRGEPLARHCLSRLAVQVGTAAVNANRHLQEYAAWGAPVWPDSADAGEFAGPLAGFLAGLDNCQSPYLCTVACDTPLFPPDLVERLAQALDSQGCNLAMAAAAEEDGQVRHQPVFCLIKVTLRDSLRAFIAGGGRKIDAWTASERAARVVFDQAHDDPRAFYNANTLEQLRQLEGS
jgi:molybdopterin-guanine dinucleotide biosynthesis protein A